MNVVLCKEASLNKPRTIVFLLLVVVDVQVSFVMSDEVLVSNSAASVCFDVRSRHFLGLCRTMQTFAVCCMLGTLILKVMRCRENGL